MGLAWAHGGHAQKFFQNFANFSLTNFVVWRTKEWLLRKIVPNLSIGHGSIKNLVKKIFENFQPLPVKMGQSWYHTLSKKSHCPKLPDKFFQLSTCVSPGAPSYQKFRLLFFVSRLKSWFDRFFKLANSLDLITVQRTWHLEVSFDRFGSHKKDHTLNNTFSLIYIHVIQTMAAFLQFQTLKIWNFAYLPFFIIGCVTLFTSKCSYGTVMQFS